MRVANGERKRQWKAAVTEKKEPGDEGEERQQLV